MRGDERPLVEDSSLRGGSLVLSRRALAAWLTVSLGRPCSVRPRRLRYKAGTSAVLAFDLTTVRDGVPVTEPCVARAYADHAAAKIAKTLEQAPPTSCLAHHVARNAVVTTAAGDRALPLLPTLARPDGVERLLRRLEIEAPDGARVHTLRHNPSRRWVGVLERDGEPPLLLRAYEGPGRTVRAADAYRGLHRSEAATPRLVGRSRALAALAVTWAEGSELSLTDGPERWAQAGRALAQLHGSSAARLPTESPRSDHGALVRTARQVAVLLPDLGPEALRIAGTTARLLAEVPRDDVALHGDLSADQVVVGPDGRPVLIDLDSAHCGPSAYDVGCLAASTLTHAEAVGVPDRGNQSLTAVLGGYQDLRRGPDPFAVAVHTVAFRLRKAVDPFRDCSPDWREQVAARVAATRAALDGLTSGGLPS